MLKTLASVALAASIALPANAAETDHATLREDALRVLERQFGAFRDETANLAGASQDFCDGNLEREAYLDSFRSTWLAWAPLDAYQFGPLERKGAVLTVAFWPDKKDFVGRGLTALLAEPEEALRDKETVAAHSAAVQGLPAIERLLFDDLPPCPAVIGISANLDAIAADLHNAWFAPGGFADLARSAGPDNVTFATEPEFTKLLFTALDFELTRIADARLGRPLGSYDRPMPRRAEAWRSGLSLALIDAQLAGIQDMLKDGFGTSLSGQNSTRIDDLLEDARARVGHIGAPLDAAVAKPGTRVRVEALQTRIVELKHRLASDIGPELGVEAGFSATDGD